MTPVPSLVLQDGQNFGILVKENEGVYSGHWLFEARGKEALRIATNMLRASFDSDVKIILGLTPVDNKAAIWFNRRLGFKSQGIIETVRGDEEMFILTKEDFQTWAA